ncbi:MAG: hypothetical protein ACK5Q5_08890 [Planctomycetaceae bacterium]
MKPQPSRSPDPHLFDPEPADAPEPGDDEQARRFERQPERAAVLRSIRLGRFVCRDGKGVSGPAQFAVLTVIADRAGAGEWWMDFEQLAAQSQLKPRQAKRAVEALKRRGIVRVRRRKNRTGQAVNHYRVNWSRAQEFIAEPSGETVPLETISAGDQSAPCGTSPSATRGTCPSATGGTCLKQKRTMKRTKEAPHEAQSSPLHQSKEPSPSSARPDGDGVSRMVWGRAVDPSELRDPDGIDGLYRIAVAEGVATSADTDRLAFFALAVWIGRQPDIANRVGLLTNILAGRLADPGSGSRNWRARPSAADEDQARVLIRRADGDDERDQSDRKALAAVDAEQAQAEQLRERKRKREMIPELRAMAQGRMPKRGAGDENPSVPTVAATDRLPFDWPAAGDASPPDGDRAP